MPEWCPKCHAMLPPGLEKCPQCGTKLKSKQKISSSSGIDLSNKDIFWYSVYIIGIGMIPVIATLLLGLLCAHLAR